MYFFKKNIGRLSKICARENAASGKNWQCGTVAKKGEKMTLTFVVQSTVAYRLLNVSMTIMNCVSPAKSMLLANYQISPLPFHFCSIKFPTLLLPPLNILVSLCHLKASI